MIDAQFVERIASELSLKTEQVAAAIHLYEGGATVPFCAKYRKDVTGNLNEAQLEAIVERFHYFIGVANRRASVIEAMEKENLLTDEVRRRIETCFDKNVLDDYALRFKPKRRTKATFAEERGLAPLADFVMKQLPGLQTVEEFANAFAKPDKGVSSPQEAFEGALYILVERFAMDPEARGLVRERMMENGKITARPTKNAEGKKTKYEAYYEFSEPVAKIPSHRMLAVLRGVKEGVLRVDVMMDDEPVLNALYERYITQPGSPFEPYVRIAVQEAYTRHLRPAIENEVMDLIRRRAEEEAIRVFRDNAASLLMAPCAGQIPVVGAVASSDGTCKFAVVNAEGLFVEHQSLLLRAPEEERPAVEQALLDLMKRHAAYTIAVSNGAAGSEAIRFSRAVLAKLDQKDAVVVTVNSSVAAGYATSRVGREEFPDLEPEVREAVSIARRVQDPLAELVRVEPRSIGVGQYQHDVNQKELREGLQHTIVSCVNRVGVDLNRASAALLRYVSGIQMGTAQNIVEAREKLGGFSTLTQLLDVPGIGPKVFEQCAGFLRLRGGQNPLDATAIHPEAYPTVEQMAASQNVPVADLLGNAELVKRIDFAAFQNDIIGPRTMQDIRSELIEPGREIRSRFQPARLVEGIASLDDLQEGVEVEGVVTNVTDFGAFVDIGVQQDGLVHLSELSNRFIKDPREIVKVGDVVRVKVIKVDKEQPRISLSIKALEPPRPRHAPRGERPVRPQRQEAPGDAHAPRPEGERAPRRRPAHAQASQDGRPQQAGERRPRREGRPEERSREGEQARRPQRPARDDRREERHSRFDEERRGPRRSDRGDGGARHAVHKPAEPPQRVNTLLADQLAALREKLGSGTTS